MRMSFSPSPLGRSPPHAVLLFHLRDLFGGQTLGLEVGLQVLRHTRFFVKVRGLLHHAGNHRQERDPDHEGEHEHRTLADDHGGDAEKDRLDEVRDVADLGHEARRVARRHPVDRRERVGVEKARRDDHTHDRAHDRHPGRSRENPHNECHHKVGDGVLQRIGQDGAELVPERSTPQPLDALGLLLLGRGHAKRVAVGTDRSGAVALDALGAPALAALGADGLGFRARVLRAGAPASGPRASRCKSSPRRGGCTCRRRGTWGRGAGPPRLLLLHWWCAWPLLLWGWGPRGGPGGALWWGNRRRRPRRPWRCRSLGLSRSRRGVDEGEDAGAAGTLQLQTRPGFLRGEPESPLAVWAEDRHDRPTSWRLVEIMQVAPERFPFGCAPAEPRPWSVSVCAVDSHANPLKLRGQSR